MLATLCWFFGKANLSKCVCSAWRLRRDHKVSTRRQNQFDVVAVYSIVSFLDELRSVFLQFYFTSLMIDNSLSEFGCFMATAATAAVDVRSMLIHFRYILRNLWCDFCVIQTVPCGSLLEHWTIRIKHIKGNSLILSKSILLYAHGQLKRLTNTEIHFFLISHRTMNNLLCDNSRTRI